VSKLIHHFLKIDVREAEFARRGFHCPRPDVRERLEYVVQTFLHGYHAALQESNEKNLASRLSAVEMDFQGFAYDGAAMALALLDGFSHWRKRFQHFLGGAGKQHIYMLHVGAGWAYARLPWLRRRIESAIRNFHPVLRWLVIDGYGFHEGYFHHRTAVQAGKMPSQLSGDARHVFYQGLGRSLWFVNGADASQISQTISSFAAQYHSDAWSGIGLACAYAGGSSRAEIDELQFHAGAHSAALAQGAAFAAKARQLADNPARHTEIACGILCGMTAEKAAALCDETLNQTGNHPSPYQQWRRLLQQSFLLETRGKSHELHPQLVAAKYS